MKFTSLCLLLALSTTVFAQQYRSKELVNSGFNDDKTAEQLARELPTIKDPYSRDSTARFLARDFRQKKQLGQAINYYQKALQGEGLSKYAKQETALELAQIYQAQKNYKDLLETLALYEQFEGKLNNNWQLQKALAYYYTEQKNQALNTSKNLLQSLASISDEQILQGLLFIYLKTQSFNNAAKVAEHLLLQQPQNSQLWFRLSHIYLQNKNYSKAANTLLLAQQSGIELEPQHLQMLIQLQAKAHNPYLAAKLLQQAMDNGILPATEAKLTQLFQFWYLAKDYANAAKALEAAYQMQKNPEHLMLAAKLYQKLENWPKLNQAITTACNNGLNDNQISAANLLLGLGFYQQQQFIQAQKAWVNASLLPGLQSQAKAYLTLIAPQKSKAQALQLSPPCLPSWAEAGTSLTFASTKKLQPPNNEKQAQTLVSFEIKPGKEQQLISGRYQIAFNALGEKVPGLVLQLAQHIVKNRGKISGNLHIIFHNINENQQVMDISLAFPVSKKPLSLGPYHKQHEQEFQHAAWLFKGLASELPQAWQNLYNSVVAKGLTPNGKSRQVVISAQGQKLTAILQLGLAP